MNAPFGELDKPKPILLRVAAERGWGERPREPFPKIFESKTVPNRIPPMNS
jgi:hypothetical protein